MTSSALNTFSKKKYFIDLRFVFLRFVALLRYVTQRDKEIKHSAWERMCYCLSFGQINPVYACPISTKTVEY